MVAVTLLERANEPPILAPMFTALETPEVTEAPLETALPIPLVTALPRVLETALLTDEPAVDVWVWLDPSVPLRDRETPALNEALPLTTPTGVGTDTPAPAVTLAEVLTPEVIDSLNPRASELLSDNVSVSVTPRFMESETDSFVESDSL